MENNTPLDDFSGLAAAMDIFVPELKGDRGAAAKSPSVKPPKKTQYSYSRLDKYCECGYRYKLTYEDGNYIDEAGAAAAVGTLVHHIEERIAGYIKTGAEIPYGELREELFQIDVPEKKAE